MELNTNWQMLGHEWAVELLQGHLTNRRVRHAYLITGPQGIGRRTLAIRLAQALNCTELVKPASPCGECRACSLIEKMQHPDLSVVQAEEAGHTLKVDQIRELHRTISLAPYEAKYKTALLLRFEEANPNAANALLKTLEEPPPNVILILTASDVEALLPTIISRCELIRLRPLSIEQVATGLQNRWGVPDDQVNLIAHLSGGRPGYALNLSQNSETLVKRQYSLDDLHSLLSTTRVERFSYAEEISKDKATLVFTLQTWLTFWRDVMLRNTGSSTPLTNIDRQEEILALSNQLGLSTHREIIHKLEHSIHQIEKNINARLVTEMLMLDLPTIL